MQLSELCAHRSTLSSGLRLVCINQPSLHGVCLSFHLNAGPRYERRDNNGCSHLVEHMLFRGTPEYPSAHALAVAMERLGGTLYGATHTEHGHMSVTLPPSTIEEGMRLFARVITCPVFSDIDIEKGIVREEILEGLDEEGRCVDADSLVRSIMFSSHPIGMPITGTLSSLEAIGMSSIVEHHARLYTGANAVLCVVGPIDVAWCERLVSECFLSLRTGVVQSTCPPERGDGVLFRFVEDQGSQSELRLAFRAPGRHETDEPAAEMLASLLDDGMSSRLYSRICDEKGLCYSVSANYEPFADDGLIDLAATVRHDRAAVVMRELCEIVSELAIGGVSEDELHVAKKRYYWGLESLLDDVEGLSDYHGLSELDGMDESLIARWKRIAAVTCDDVVRVARRVFSVSEGASGAAVVLGALQKTQCREIKDALSRLRA